MKKHTAKNLKIEIENITPNNKLTQKEMIEI